jgi:ABC-2 type transport system ATP-binding protein
MSIKVSGLTKIYNTQKALDSISFTAPKGSITGFLGPNGAGKSTTMKIATGYLFQDSGSVSIDDIEVGINKLDVKRKIGYLPEHNPLYLSMYVKEFLFFVAKVYGIPAKQRKTTVNEIIELCGLDIESHKKIGYLSKGYRQRVGLAKALIHSPDVLILDEPTTGLDPNQILEIRQVIKNISQDKTVLLSTHIMQEVEALCENVVIIDKGSIVADDSLENIKRARSNSLKIEIEFEEQVDLDLFSSLGKERIVQNGKFLTVESTQKDLRNALLKITSENNLPLVALKNVGSSLEEVFHQLTGKEDNS